MSIHYPISDRINDEALKKQKEWCELTDIDATPTIFINGRKLTEPYQTEDIKYFV